MSHLGFMQRWRAASLAGLLLLGVLGGGGESFAAKKPSRPRAAAVRKANPEELLADIYRELAENNLRAAQAKADALVQAYPTFRLGHLLRGDLLLMHTRPVTQLGAAVPPGADAKLADLRREAAVRLQAETRPADTLLPRALLQMRKDQRHALIV